MIGLDPVVDDWIVTRGQGLTHRFETTPNTPFPDDTTLTVHALSPRDTSIILGVWPAVSYTSTYIQVQIDATDLATLPDGAGFRVYITYPDSPTTCWYRGRIWRRD